MRGEIEATDDEIEIDMEDTEARTHGQSCFPGMHTQLVGIIPEPQEVKNGVKYCLTVR